MNQSVALIRSLIIYGVCLPLAIYLGYLLATPDNWGSVIVVALVLGALLLPVLLIWHHSLLLFFWQSAFVVPFLASQPPIWLALAVTGLTAAVLKRALNRGSKFLSAWPVMWPLLFFALLILATAKFNGGLNLRASGSSVYGGRRYVYLLAAIMGFFAFVSRRIPLEKARAKTAIFMISGVTAAISLLVLVVPPSWYWIFWLVPPDTLGLQSMTIEAFGNGSDVVRLGGFSTAGMAVYYLVLSQWGIRQLFTFKGLPWLLIMLGSLFLCLFAGFRSALIVTGLTFALVFVLEGLVGTRLFAGLAVLGILAVLLLVPFIDRLPLSVQRSLSFLPLKIDPIVEMDARNSTEWRVRMWQAVLPEVSTHLWVGKGYAIDSHDLEFAVANPRLIRDANEVSLLAGDYHNGPLSVVIPFGLPGLACILWFFSASIWALYRNYRYGDPQLKIINTFLLATFVVRVVFFFAVFGSLYSDFFVFTGLIGFGISLNGGIAPRPLAAAAPVPAMRAPRRTLPAAH